jgi:pentatricopeptide repeat protein
VRTFSASTSNKRKGARSSTALTADDVSGREAVIHGGGKGGKVMLKPDHLRKEMPQPTKVDHQIMFDILMAPIAQPAVTRRDVEAQNSRIDEFFAEREKNVKNFETLVELQAYKGEYTQAIQTMAIMKELGFEVTARIYEHVIAACGVGNRKDLIARYLSEAMEALKADISLYTTAIRAFGKTGELDKAWQLVLDVEKDHEITRDAVFYTAYIHSCIQHKEADKAWDAYWWMRSRDITPDPITYGLMMHLCAITDRTERAFLFLEEMDKQKMPLVEANYNSLIHACAKRSDTYNYKKAFEIFARMKVDGYIPDVVTYNALLNVCSRRGDVEACEMIFDEMMDKRTATFKPNTTTYGLLLYCYASAIKFTPLQAREAHITKAEKLFATMLAHPKEHKITSQTLDSVLRMYANALMHQTAVDFFNKYSTEFGCNPTENTHIIMIRMWNRLIEPEKAQETFMALRNSGVTPSYSAYLVLINGCVMAKYYKRAIKYMKEMRILGMFPHIDDMSFFRSQVRTEYPDLWEEIGTLCDWAKDHDKYYYAPKVYLRRE